MEASVGRRVFVGAVIAGVPLLTTEATRALAQTAEASGAGHIHPQLVVDPVVDHIARELAALHNAMRRDAQGESLRAFAAQLRTLAVYGRHTDLDARVASSIGELIDKDGCDAVLNFEPGSSDLRSELERYGAIADERVLNRTPDLSPTQRSAVLERLRQSGLSPSWERLASLFERVAADVDRRSATAIRVSRQDEAYWEGYCTELWSQFSETQFIAGMMCAASGLPIIGAGFLPLCVSYELAALVLGYVYAGYCKYR